MSLSHKKLLTGLMLIILVMNMMLLAFQVKAVLHDLNQADTSITSRSNSTSTFFTHVIDNQDIPELIEHQLLHAADHVQFFLFSFLLATFSFSPLKVLLRHISINLIPMMLESPFRPPRAIS